VAGLIHELRRRTIFRVAGVYAVVGWILAQASGVLEDALGLPAWFDTLVVSLLLIGFPIAMLLAWAFEMTPVGVKRTEVVADEVSGTAKTGRKLDFLIVRGADKNNPHPEVRPEVAMRDENTNPDAASIAVLPFGDLSPNKDQAHFSDGMAEEILNDLANLSGLEVASRTSSFQFKGQEAMGIPVIARQLHVPYPGGQRKKGRRYHPHHCAID
jgi:uncharacterized membrane protein YhdT